MALSNYGSFEDIRTHLKLHKDNYSIAQLHNEIAYEKKNQNRKSVINLCESAIRAKEKAHAISRSAVTGKFVKKSFAKKHPKTTVTEKIK